MAAPTGLRNGGSRPWTTTPAAWDEWSPEALAQAANAASDLRHHVREADPFVTRVQPVPGLPGHAEGHEVLTRMAAVGLPVDLAAVLRGVIRPDRGGTSYWRFPAAALHASDPAEQRRHALRRTRATSLAAALAEIRQYFTLLYRRSLAARARPGVAFEWVGEMLHLIQDSYSQAHVVRAYRAGPGGSHPIRRVRWFSFSLIPGRSSRAPDEHDAPTDRRDGIWASSGVLKPEAGLARDASRELLLLMLRHLGAPTAPTNAAELGRYMARHLSTGAPSGTPEHGEAGPVEAFSWELAEGSHAHPLAEALEWGHELEAIYEQKLATRATIKHWTGALTINQAIDQGHGKYGIYIFEKSGKPIYVGKAGGSGNDLGSRVAAYAGTLRSMAVDPRVYRVRLGILATKNSSSLRQRILDVERAVIRSVKNVTGAKLTNANKTGRLRAAKGGIDVKNVLPNSPRYRTRSRLTGRDAGKLGQGQRLRVKAGQTWEADTDGWVP
jgi:hypothetical protein